MNQDHHGALQSLHLPWFSAFAFRSCRRFETTSCWSEKMPGWLTLRSREGWGRFGLGRAELEGIIIYDIWVIIVAGLIDFLRKIKPMKNHDNWGIISWSCWRIGVLFRKRILVGYLNVSWWSLDICHQIFGTSNLGFESRGADDTGGYDFFLSHQCVFLLIIKSSP